MHLAWHLTSQLPGRAPIVSTLHSRRVAAEILLRSLKDRGLLAFSVPDDHMHILVLGGREEAGRAAQVAESGLKQVLGLPGGFLPVHVQPLASRAHLERALTYILAQHQHHGVLVDPLRESSSLPDLLTLRTVAPWLPLRVKEAFPRLKREDLVPLLGVRTIEGGGDLAGLGEVVESATLGLDPLPLRIAAAQLCRERGLSPRAVQGLLGASARTVRRWGGLKPDPLALEAVRRQLAVRAQIGHGGAP